MQMTSPLVTNGQRIRVRVGKNAQSRLAGDDDPMKRIQKIMLDAGARPIFQEMLDGMVKKQRFAFNVGGHQTRGGPKWEKLATSTALYKAKHGWSPLILVRTTQLKLSQEGMLRPNADGGMSLWLFNRCPWFKYHDTGTKNMPQRQPIVVTKQDEEFIKAGIAKGLTAYING